jgi:membrane-associated phospholipid phosphatase
MAKGGIKTLLGKNKLPLIIYGAFFLAALVLMMIYNKAGLHQLINSLWSPVQDRFYLIFTNTGDGMALVVTAMILLLVRYRWAFAMGISGVFAGLLVNLFKKAVFGNTPRPLKYFEGTGIELHIADPKIMHMNFSFPSGHTTSAFAMFFLLLLITRHRLLKLFFLACALLAAYSRVYLSQHFLQDATAGSFLGIICAMGAYLIFTNIKARWLDDSLIYDRA